jgi:phosphoribosylformimino-5-aminoimidazole carboxamide ribonucleotide (ProFAR) isomerase
LKLKFGGIRLKEQCEKNLHIQSSWDMGCYRLKLGSFCIFNFDCLQRSLGVYGLINNKIVITIDFIKSSELLTFEMSNWRTPELLDRLNYESECENNERIIGHAP